MTIHISEQALQTKLEELAAAFNSILSEKDAEITTLQETVSTMESAPKADDSEQVKALEARLEKAKEFFKAQKAEIAALKEENESLKGQLADAQIANSAELPF